MRLLFFGLGSIGQRHLYLVQKHFPEHEVFHFVRTGMPWPNVKSVASWEEVKRVDPDVAFICNPSNYHIDTALRCADLGINLFIEKPLGVENGSKLNDLLDVVKGKDLTAYVAYPFRHSDQIKRLKGRIPRSTKTARIVCRTDITRWGKEYGKKASSGGGAILELSHEIDYAQFLFGPINHLGGCAIFCSNRFTDAETSAVINCFHESGFVSRVELDLMSNVEDRFIECGNIEVNLEVNSQMYLNQLKYFFDNIGNPMLENNIFEAAKLFQHIVDFKRMACGCLC